MYPSVYFHRLPGQRQRVQRKDAGHRPLPGPWPCSLCYHTSQHFCLSNVASCRWRRPRESAQCTFPFLVAHLISHGKWKSKSTKTSSAWAMTRSHELWWILRCWLLLPSSVAVMRTVYMSVPLRYGDSLSIGFIVLTCPVFLSIVSQFAGSSTISYLITWEWHSGGGVKTKQTVGNTGHVVELFITLYWLWCGLAGKWKHKNVFSAALMMDYVGSSSECRNRW